MKNLLTCTDLASLDKEAINNYEIPSILLIEQASIGTLKILEQQINDLEDKKFLFILGKGNNAGDGLALARNLYYKGIKNIVIALTQEIGSESYNIELKIAKNLGFEFIDFKKVEPYINNCDVIIDALYGTGFKPTLREEGLFLINLINKSVNKTIISLDIPSGLSDTSNFEDTSVLSNITVTFGKIKSCFFPPLSRLRCGKIFLVNPGFPLDLLERSKSNCYLYNKKDIKINTIGETTHKNNRGHVAVFSGDKGKVGASILAGKAAFTSGAGLVTLIGGENKNFPEFMSENTLEENKYDAVLFGNGRDPLKKENLNLLSNILKLDIPTVLDAGALRLLNQVDKLLFVNRKNSLILTPHLGEYLNFSQKQGNSLNYINESREIAKRYNAIIVIKSYITWVVTEKDVFILDNPNSSLAVAGSGDVLAGIITSLLAQGNNALEASKAGVAIHNRAGFLTGAKYYDPMKLIIGLEKAMKELN